MRGSFFGIYRQKTAFLVLFFDGKQHIFMPF